MWSASEGSRLIRARVLGSRCARERMTSRRSVPTTRRGLSASRMCHLCLFLFILGSAELAAATTTIFHFALRPDGQTGVGTAGDPFDGSTPERLAAALAQIPAGRIRVQFGPGTFVTNGVPIQSGWTVAGAGPERTILKLAPNLVKASGQTALLIGRADYGGPETLLESACVRDLALDGNRDAQPAFRLGGTPCWIDAVVLWTRDGRIENVRVRNTFTAPGEGFPVLIYSTGGTRQRPHRAEIVKVWVDRHVGYATSISAFDQTGTFLTGGIRNCRVTGFGGPPSSNAFGAGGWQNFRVEGNYVEGMAAGVVIDTHDYGNVSFVRNTFRRLWKFGFLINGSGRYDGLTIARNRVDLSGREAGAVVKFDTARIRRLRLVDNVFAYQRPTVLLETGPAVQGLIARNRVPRGATFRLPRGSQLQVAPTPAGRATVPRRPS